MLDAAQGIELRARSASGMVVWAILLAAPAVLFPQLDFASAVGLGVGMATVGLRGAASQCVEQLGHDGCLPSAGGHKCADCAEGHRADLEKAGCSHSFVLNWCEGRTDGCRVELLKQESVHVNCTRGFSYGCVNSSTMWAAGGCRGVFACGSATSVLCSSGRSQNVTCDCRASSKPPPPPSINASTVTVMVFGDSWGSLGPGWHELQDMFDHHNISAVVRSAARGGTQACQWAESPESMVAAAQKLFPERKTKGVSAPAWQPRAS
jgi:hypothetical protein